MAASTSPSVRMLGRYALYDPIAAGGMATVHFGRLLGAAGFARTVAIKRLHPQFAHDPDFVGMFLDEARLAARVRHPNVVQTLDVVSLDGEVFLVMDYVQGESLARLVRTAAQQGKKVPLPYAVAIVAGALQGLHAAHEAKDERGEELGIVHRDVSPQNILVGVDGVPRVLDFGVAKAIGRSQVTREGQVKGKMSYIAPEQLRGAGADRRTDVYAAGVVLWEAITGKRLFVGDNDVEVFGRVLAGKVDAPSAIVPDIPAALDAVVLRALATAPENRFATAREMARALQATTPLVATAEVGEWVEEVGAAVLAARAQAIVRIEAESSAPSRPIPAERLPLAEQSASGVAPVRGGAPQPGPLVPPPGEATEISVGSLSEAPWSPSQSAYRGRVIAIVAGSVVAAVLAVVLIAHALSRGGEQAPSANASPAASSAPVIAVAAGPPSAPAPSAAAAPTVAGGVAPSTTPGASAAASPPPVGPQPAQGTAPAATPASPPRSRPVATAVPAPRPSGGALDGVLDSRK